MSFLPRPATSHLLLAGLSLLAAFGAACSDDSTQDATTNSTGVGGAGGEAGGPPTSGGGGAGGAGGSSCDICTEDACDAELAACATNVACQAWSACVDACTPGADPAACASACNQLHDGAALLYEPLYACVCSACEAPCGPLDSCNQACVDDVDLPLDMVAPADLADTGLYDANGDLASYVRPFAPRYELWADAAEKTRLFYVPKCTQIDSTDMDHWEMPVGTRFWKEFRRDDGGGNDIRVETRLIHRFGEGPTDWLFATYQWDSNAANPEGTTATFTGGAAVQNANGTSHDIPSEAQCRQCHETLPERILGFGAIELTHSDAGEPTTISTLSNENRLTVGNAAGFPVPGNATEAAALGYLHANCGHCHSATGITFIDQKFRLLVAQTTVATTDTFLTAVDQPVTGAFASNPLCGGGTGCDRIDSIGAATSAVTIRMGSRALGVQMPPIATQDVDTAGLQAVTDWIEALP